MSKAAAGIFVDISKTTQTKIGTLAVCKLRSGTTVLIKTADLEIYKGKLDDANGKKKSLISRKYRLLSKIDARTKILITKANSANPHKNALDSVKKEYNEFWKKVQTLQAKRDKASGEEHMNISDELRQMKGADIRLSQKRDEIQKQYNAWKRNNARPPTDDKETNRLKLELAGLEKQILTTD